MIIFESMDTWAKKIKSFQEDLPAPISYLLSSARSASPSLRRNAPSPGRCAFAENRYGCGRVSKPKAASPQKSDGSASGSLPPPRRAIHPYHFVSKGAAAPLPAPIVRLWSHVLFTPPGSYLPCGSLPSGRLSEPLPASRPTRRWVRLSELEAVAWLWL